MAEKKEFKTLLCLRGLKVKEEGDNLSVEGLVATTHADREGDMLSINALVQVRDYINDTSIVGQQLGAYRSVSLFHDWIHNKDPTLDEAAFLEPTAKIVDLEDGHSGVEVKANINKFYKGDMTPEEIKYRIDNGAIAGFSIEYDFDKLDTKQISYQGKDINFIEKLSRFGGTGFARARIIANPNAVIYKEIEQKAKEVITMTEEEKKAEELKKAEEVKKAEEIKKAEEAAKVEEIKKAEEAAKVEAAKKSEEDDKNKDLKEKEKKLSVKEIIESKDFKEAVAIELKVKSRVLKEGAEEQQMETIGLRVKEMNDAIKAEKFNPFKYKEIASGFFAENPLMNKEFLGAGIPLNTTLQVKCAGKKLMICGELKTKDTLDTATNTTAYTQSPVELADVYLPGVIDTFNQSTGLYGDMRKVDHLMGGNRYGWRITTTQATGLSVDPDDTSVVKRPVGKLKVQTEIKVYRAGVSVTDYMIHHSRASIGDLFMIEVEKTSRDLLKDINGDLFTEQVDTAGNQILGLEAVADASGNTEMYGLTRSTANRLAPATATDTYTAVGGALTTANIRLAARKPEVEGALRVNLRIIVNPTQRDALFELEDGNQRYFTPPQFGFEGKISYDGIPVITDSDCQTDALFVVDYESYYLVISKAPQLVGLARVGAAEEAYVEIYFAVVYEQPRRIYMLDTLDT